MISAIEEAAAAVASLRDELTALATVLNSPEELVIESEGFMTAIEEALEKLLSAIGGTRSLVDKDTIRNLVLGGDTVCVSFYGDMGAGCLYLQPDGDEPLVMEDRTCDRRLRVYWDMVSTVAA